MPLQRWPSRTERSLPLTSTILVLISVLYPALVYFGLTLLSARAVAFLVLILGVARALGSRGVGRWFAGLGAAGLAMMALASNQVLPLKLYPVLVNALLLAFFLGSVFWPPTVIERLARLREPDLPARAQDYARKVTWVWCVFFLVNGGISLWTALAADDVTWTLYNGLVSYLLIGTLFAGEWLVRQRVRARNG
ncbi:MAG: hypothetical protein KatS3mg126_0638 [Lysobacteraceae bacterium]|nr:MAG: hypothetical protein KatS3mg126_0638 [Xanthomonadaceae bacterium]